MNDSKNKIALAMIVRDESLLIEECLKSVLPIIDYWVVIDTGSTDDTVDIVRQTLRDIPGELIEESWSDFSTHRNKAFERARKKSDYVFTLDADEILDIVSDPHTIINSMYNPGYLVEIMVGTIRYSRTLMLKSSVDWIYVGQLHEVPYVDGDSKREIGITRITGMRVVNGGQAEVADRTRNRSTESDISLLIDLVKTSPSEYRNHYYLAHCYLQIGEPLNAIRCFRSALSLGAQGYYKWSCLYSVGLASLKAQQDLSVSIEAFKSAYDFDPERSESLYRLMQIYQVNDEVQSAYALGLIALDIAIPENQFPCDLHIYEVLLPVEVAVCAQRLGYNEVALKLYNAALVSSFIQPALSSKITENLAEIKQASQVLVSKTVEIELPKQ